MAPRDVDSHEPTICPAVISGRRDGGIKAYLGIFVAVAFCVYLALAVAAVVRSKRRAGREGESLVEFMIEDDSDFEGFAEK